MHNEHVIDTSFNRSIEIHRRLSCSEERCGIRIIHLATIACSACFSITPLLRAASISFVSHDLGLHDTVYVQSLDIGPYLVFWLNTVVSRLGMVRFL